MWASQLLTVLQDNIFINVAFDFTNTHDYAGLNRVELVMFNCPQWGISVQFIHIFGESSTVLVKRCLGSIILLLTVKNGA